MREGVTVMDPATTWIDSDVVLAPDVTILPGTQLLGATVVAEDAVIGPDTTLKDCEIGPGARVVRTHAELAVVGGGANVGPYSYLRPGTNLGAGGKIGGFVETKNAVIGDGAKVPHLSYVGDAEIGAGTNIGAGTIFANYDGVKKHRTTIGRHARTASNNTFVAPVEIGDGAATGAGTVVREDVPPGALAVSAGPQRTIEGWALAKRAGTPQAEAAQAAFDAQARAEGDVAHGAADAGVDGVGEPGPGGAEF
jgi:bifunctional UDP-N-acetylglucosamine pyrophosphorylase/glucosamine-1-phosphate N-acetyltransferase